VRAEKLQWTRLLGGGEGRGGEGEVKGDWSSKIG